jgi:eukaryotic-like serine/threonine-protein kinase
MIQAASCPSAPDIQRLLLGQSAEEESVSLEEHLLHCEKCLRTVQTLSPEDSLISALQQGCESATPAPFSGLLDKVRRQLLEMRTPSAGMDQPNTGDTLGAAPSPTDATQDVSMSLAPAQLPDEIGRLGGYRILKELGRGGMGVVYQAEDPKLKRLVALKAMLPRLAADESARQRFLREAQAMAAVHHDHIITIFQVDENNGVPFLAMEFLDGMPLDKWLKDGREPNLAQILRMGREIAEGLAAAHERGLIHRDVKPGNIWLDSAHKGRVKILDFGLARVGTDDVHLTRSGAIVGTPAYMSPEQARGEKVDERTDLFSLGCVLYRLCTGAMPFAGDTTMSLLLALAMDHPKTVRDVNPEIPAALSDLVMRLLAKAPAERLASAREVVSVIEAVERNPIGVTEAKTEGESRTEIMAPSPSALPPIPSKRRRTAALVLLAGAAAAALAGSVIYVQTDRGTLEIKTLDPDVKVSVEKDGASVDILDPKSKQQLSIHSGQYTLKLIGADTAGLELTTDQGTGPVTLTRGGKVVVEVRRVDEPAIATAPGERAAKSAFPPLDEAWVKLVASLPAAAQVEAVTAKLKERNPGFDGKLDPFYKDNAVKWLSLTTDDVADLTPLRAIPSLTRLSIIGINPVKSRFSDLSQLKGMPLTALTCQNTAVSDLSPLKDMKLTELGCVATPVSDLSPLRGMKLTKLNIQQAAVSDLSPLKGMPLTDLNCEQTRVSNLSPLKGMPLTALSYSGMPISDLSPLKGMKLTWLGCSYTGISDLSPLKGMPLTGLRCSYNPVSDLSPLKDMKLTYLDLGATQVSDLSLLKGMPLKNLYCNFKPERDAELLRSIKTLETINDKPAAEFWKEVAGKPTFPPLDEAWVKKVRDLPAEKQVEEVAAELMRRNPGFDGKTTPAIAEGVVTDLQFLTDDVADISPVRALVGLRTLQCGATVGKGRLSDLSPLKGMELTSLSYQYTLVSDLSPLKGMKLTWLSCGFSPVSDLSPLTGMPLWSLNCGGTKVSDLSPLKDMKLTQLWCFSTPVSDLSPLKGMPLTGLICAGTAVADLSPLKGMKLGVLQFRSAPVSDLSPLKGMPLQILDCRDAPVSDLSPLKGTPLKVLDCDFKPARDAAILRSIATLETINTKPAAEFWKEVEAGKGEKKP